MEEKKYKMINTYTVSEEYYYRLIDSYAYDCRDSVSSKEFKYKAKNYRCFSRILIDDARKYICCYTGAEHLFSIYRMEKDQKEDINYKQLNGEQCYKKMMRLLKKYYTVSEIEKQLHLFEAEYDASKIQVHRLINQEKNIVYRYKNCIEYDINGAHTYALSIIFPKASSELKKLYLKSKEKDKQGNKLHPEYKNIFNFFVGQLVNKGFRKTYNWIVQKTTETLNKSIEAVDGIILYANTDGYIVQNNVFSQHTSNELGDFKEEYSGDVYIYQSENYYIIKTNKLKGSMRCNLRNKIKLEEGKVIEYDITYDHCSQVIKNIKEKTVHVKIS